MPRPSLSLVGPLLSMLVTIAVVGCDGGATRSGAVESGCLHGTGSWLHVWDFDGEAPVWKVRLDSQTSALAASTDGLRLATVHEGQVMFWDASTGHLLRSVAVNVGRATASTISPDFRWLAVSRPASIQVQRSRVEVWDLESGTLGFTFALHEEYGHPSGPAAGTSAWFSSDSQRVLTYDSQRIGLPGVVSHRFDWWSLDTGQVIATFDAGKTERRGDITVLNGAPFWFDAAGERLFLTDFTGEGATSFGGTRVLNSMTFEEQRRFDLDWYWSSNYTQGLEIYGDRAAAVKGGTVLVWDLPSEEVVSEIYPPGGSHPEGVDDVLTLSPRGDRLLTGGSDPCGGSNSQLHLWELPSGALLKIFPGRGGYAIHRWKTTHSPVFLPDQERFATVWSCIPRCRRL